MMSLTKRALRMREVILVNTDLSVGDFVLVNFATKHRSLLYVGMVEKVEDDEILSQFLRRITLSGTCSLR